MNFEQELQRIAEQYRTEGYAVLVHPDRDHLSGFPDDVSADILAARGPENVLIEVKRTRAEVGADPKIPWRAERVNARPGWRYDLVVLEKESPTQRVADRSIEPTGQQFREMLNRARVAKGTGLNEMALTYAWAALETAMRQTRDEAGPNRWTPPTELLRTLYGNGSLSKPEFDRAKTAWNLRTQAVHGFATPEIDPALIDDMISLASRVRGFEEMQPSATAG